MNASSKRHAALALAGVLSLGLALSGCGGGGSGVATDADGGTGGMGTGTGDGTGGMDSEGMGSGTGGGSTDWLLTGTQKSGQARREAIAAIEELDAMATDRLYLVGSDKPLGRIAALPVADGEYAVAEASIDSWGDWSHPSMSADIAKVQRINEYAGARALEIARQVVGLMDHGYFGVSHAAKRFNEGSVSNEGRSLVTAFHAFHAADDSISGALPLRSLDLDGARWTGDALGVERASETVVFGPASLSVGGGAVGPGTSEVTDYAVRLDVAWSNGDRLRLDGSAIGADGSIRHIGDSSGSGDGSTGEEAWRLGGKFAGANAEEALGAFRTVDYVGSFGVRRRP